MASNVATREGHTVQVCSKVTKIVTPDELRDLVANPAVFVKAPGAGKVIMPWRCFITKLDGDAYNTDTATTYFYVGDFVIDTDQSPTLNGASAWGIGTYFYSMDATTLADVEDQPLQLKNTGSDITGGSGSIKFSIYYTVEDI